MSEWILKGLFIYFVSVLVENGLTPVQMTIALENKLPDFTEMEEQRQI